MNDKALQFLFGDIGKPPMPSPDQTPRQVSGTPVADGTADKGAAPNYKTTAAFATSQQLKQLKARVADNAKNIDNIGDVQTTNTLHVKSLSKKFESEVKKLQVENECLKDEVAMLKKIILKGSECTTKLGDDEAGSQ